MVDRILLLILIKISFISCVNYIKIPLKYYPSQKYNDSSPSYIFDNIVNQKLYARINIGTPKTEIHLAILFDANEFFISANLDGYHPNDFTDLQFIIQVHQALLKTQVKIMMIHMQNILVLLFVNKMFFILIIKKRYFLFMKPMII